MFAQCIRMPVIRSSTTSLVTNLVVETLDAPKRLNRIGANILAPISPIDLRVTELAKSFNGVPIFKDVTFELTRSEVVAIVGANGTGKSTLLRCLMGLIPTDAGEIDVLDTNLRTASNAELRTLRSKMGHVKEYYQMKKGRKNRLQGTVSRKK